MAKGGNNPAFAGIDKTTDQIPGLGFFPGGDGLWKNQGSSVPVSESPKTIMVVGSTFGCTRYFEQLRKKGPLAEEARGKDTWGNLPPPIKRRMETCFFTNAYPGLLRGDSNVDVELLPAELDSVYMAESQAFFAKQVECIKPRLILLLGKLPLFVFGAARLRELGWWKLLNRKSGCLESFRALDESGKSFIRDGVRIQPEHPCGVAVLLHPCKRNMNLSKRSLAYAGPDPESEFLEDVIRKTHD